MATKPRLLLPDANVVLEAMRQGRWEALCRSAAVVIPELIVDEVRFYQDKSGNRIDLLHEAVPGSSNHRLVVSQPVGRAAVPDAVSQGEFTIWQAPGAEFMKTKSLLHPDLASRVDDGEQEAITYLRLAPDPEGIQFLTADSGAIQAAVAFDFGQCLVSLDMRLKACGQQAAVAPEFGDEHLKRCRDLGAQRVIEGRALATKVAPATRSRR